MPVPTLIPRETLFGNPEKASPKISPDGSRLAFLAPDEGVLNVWLSPTLDPARARPLTKDRGRGIRSFFWAEDKESLVYLQDKDGDENWHLYQVDLSSGSVRDLTPFPGSQAQVIATEPRFPEELLVAVNVRDKRFHDAYRISLKTGKAELEEENPGDVIGWLADLDFKVRVAKAALPDGGGQLRVKDGASWRPVLTWGAEDAGGAHGFTPDNKSLYVESSLDSDTSRLLELELRTGKTKEIFRHPEADLAGVLTHPTTYALQAAACEVDRLEWTIFDDSIRKDFENLSSFCTGDYQIASRDDADRFWIVLDSSDKNPPRYHLFDRKSKKASFLFTTRPALERYSLASMKPVTIRARDGLRLRAYLSLPPGAQPQKPFVLIVHGGPWARDHWGFNPEAQWLANRGYATLQVNFRGSLGFGKKFLHAGDREWGAKMQNDLTDAVGWAVAQGIADPKRIAIYGGSYGGYAALAGAAFTPGLYACAVDVVGPSNLITLIKSIPPYWEPLRRIFDLRVGNADTEPDFLKSRSPLFAAEKIRIPLLIAQGANDPRVKRAESEAIVQALKAKGKEVEYLLFADEGHGFARPENRLDFYARAEAFLARHLGGRCQEKTATAVFG